MTLSDLDAARLSVVRDHMHLETVLDFDAVMQTFDHPRYELVGTDTVFDGPEAVMAYFKGSRTPFPEQSNEIIALRPMQDAVLAEFWLTGTHLGPLKHGGQVVEPTGKAFRVRMAAIFEFTSGGTGIVCERVYFDQASILRQIGVVG
jgi:hypothetical protein